VTNVTVSIPDEYAENGAAELLPQLLASMDDSDEAQARRVCLYRLLGVTLDVVGPEEVTDEYREAAADALAASVDTDNSLSVFAFARGAFMDAFNVTLPLLAPHIQDWLAVG
jgi:hypothetical protein